MTLFNIQSVWVLQTNKLGGMKRILDNLKKGYEIFK